MTGAKPSHFQRHVNGQPLVELANLMVKHSRVELHMLRLWLARERAWGLAMRDGLA